MRAGWYIVSFVLAFAAVLCAAITVVLGLLTLAIWWYNRTYPRSILLEVGARDVSGLVVGTGSASVIFGVSWWRIYRRIEPSRRERDG